MLDIYLSILNNIENVIQKLWKSLRVNSPFYMSFKYGENSYIKNERFFQNYNEHLDLT